MHKEIQGKSDHVPWWCFIHKCINYPGDSLWNGLQAKQQILPDLFAKYIMVYSTEKLTWKSFWGVPLLLGWNTSVFILIPLATKYHQMFNNFCCCCLVDKLCPTPCDPMNCSPPGSSVHGISQARMLEWVVISSSRGSSWLRDQTHISSTGRRVLYCWATRDNFPVNVHWWHTHPSHFCHVPDKGEYPKNLTSNSFSFYCRWHHK